MSKVERAKLLVKDATEKAISNLEAKGGEIDATCVFIEVIRILEDDSSTDPLKGFAINLFKSIIAYTEEAEGTIKH